MSSITDALIEFGLTRNETEVYLILLRAGNLTASQIAEKTTIHRINVYSILEKLQEKGIISYSKIGKRKFYEAADPKIILQLEEERKGKLASILPELMSQKSISKVNQEATIYKDRKGVKAVLEDVVTSKKEVCMFASGWGFSECYPEYFEIWHKKLEMNSKRARTLISSKYRKIKILKPWEYRFLPSKFQFPTTMIIYGDKVFLLIWGEPPLGIVIRSQELSKSFKTYFEILWASAKS
jgi:sugar-specific transcriptional regulator TrmB